MQNSFTKSPQFSITYPHTDMSNPKSYQLFGEQIDDPFRWLEDIQTTKVKNFVSAQNALTDKFLQKNGISYETMEDTPDASISKQSYFARPNATPSASVTQTTGTGSIGLGDGASEASAVKTRELIHSRLANLWTHCEQYNCPFKRGDRYFYLKNGILYMSPILSFLKENSEKTQGQIVLDPSSGMDGFSNMKLNAKSSEYKIRKMGHVGLSRTSKQKTEPNFGHALISVSTDGNILAYGLSPDGSIWSVVHFKDLNKSKHLENDVLNLVRHDAFLAWTKESDGVFYAKYPSQNAGLNEKIYFHSLGTTQAQDTLIFEFVDKPECQLKPRVTDCGNYLLVLVACDWKFAAHTELYYAEMTKIRGYIKENEKDRGKYGAKFRPLVLDFKWDYGYITNRGNIFYFVTNNKAPNYKVVHYKLEKGRRKVDPSNPAWPVLVPQYKRHTLDWILCCNRKYLLVVYVKDCRSDLQLRCLCNGQLLYQFPLGLGTITEYCTGSDQTECFLKFTSFLVPDTLYRLNLADSHMEKCKMYRKPIACSCFATHLQYKYKVPIEKMYNQSILKDLDLEKYSVEQISFASGSQGNKVPLFLVHKKSLSKNGKNPTLLHCYGGLHTRHRPTFEPPIMFFIEHFDGIYAVANIRGGRAKGEKWYEDGAGARKQNSLTDFQNAAKYLVRARYTCPSKLVIWGYSSNGGLIVAACANQKPSLFGAAVVEYGALDLIRLQQFSFGPGWVNEFGNMNDRKEFLEMLRISPVHGVKALGDDDEQYPAMLLITAENDQVLSPMHAYKMIAQLQSKIGNSPKQMRPFLLRVEERTGFEKAGITQETAVDEFTDIFTFIALNLSLTFSG